MDDCIEWGKAKNYKGYGIVTYKGRSTVAHRVAWERAIGPIPRGLCVLHKCDNRACVNVEHLFLGTQIQNIADRDAKGRQARGSKAGRTKLTEKDVVEIRDRYWSGDSNADLAREYGLDFKTVSRMVFFETWKHI